MNSYYWQLLACLGGALLAMQGALNSRLGVLLHNPLWATFISYCIGAFLVLGYLLAFRSFPNKQMVQHVPTYLWFAGAICSVVGISMYFYAIPKLGVSTMISVGLAGQLLLAFVAGHFGWFNFPKEPINSYRVFGLLSLILGVVLINFKK